MKIIELRGVEFVNKGAELMLYAIREQLSNRYPNVILVMGKTGRTPIHKQRELNIYTKLNFQRYGINFSKIGPFIPKSLRRKLKFILESEIDVVVDGSGFAFGDQWGAAYGEAKLASKVGKWKKEGKKIILLPQALGPFKEESSKKMMKKIIENSHLIFAREEKSYSYIKKLGSYHNIYQAPDFTNLVKGKSLKDFDASVHEVAIIPNYKMIEKSQDKGKAYYDFLESCICHITAAKLKPYFLIHEGQRDLNIAMDVNSRLNKPIPVIDPGDPLKVKGVIGTALFTLSSRYHGAISSLSQGIPCIITSWSHKYQYLAEEYSCKSFVVEEMSRIEKGEELISWLKNEENRASLNKHLLRKAEEFRRSSREMWTKVFRVIENK